MLVRVAVMALASVAVCLGWLAWRVHGGVTLDAVRTEVFTLLAMCQWFNVINCESATRSALRLGVLGNRWLLAGLAASLVLQAAVVYLPPLNALFHTVPLHWHVLLPLLALASVVLWAEEVRKAIARASGART